MQTWRVFAEPVTYYNSLHALIIVTNVTNVTKLAV